MKSSSGRVTVKVEETTGLAMHNPERMLKCKHEFTKDGSAYATHSIVPIISLSKRCLD
jgi:hypothetical protein